WINNSNFATTGTITIDDVALTLNATLTGPFSNISGAAYNEITDLQFSTTTCTITNAPITIATGSTTTYSITGGNFSTVDPVTLTEVRSEERRVGEEWRDR